MPSAPYLRLTWALLSFLAVTIPLGGAAAVASDDEDVVQRAFSEKWGVQIQRRTTGWTTRNGNPIMWVVRSAAGPVNKLGESLNTFDIITRVNGVPATTPALLKAVTESDETQVRLTVIASRPLHDNSGDPEEWLLADDVVRAPYRTILLEGVAVGRDQPRQTEQEAEDDSSINAPWDLAPYKLLSLTDFVDEPEKYVGQGKQSYVRMPLWIASNGIRRMREVDSTGRQLIDGYGCYAADGERSGDNGEYVGNLMSKLNRGGGEINITFASRDMARSLKDSIPVGKALRFDSLVSTWSIEDKGQPIYGVSIHYLEAQGAPVFDKATMSLIPAKPIVFRADVFEKRAALRRQLEEAGSPRPSVAEPSR